MKLFMNPISSSSIPSKGQSIQILRIQNPQKATLRIRFKISYTLGESNDIIHDIGEITFPDIEEQ